MYEYKATVLRIVDGDTVELAIDVGFNITITENIRLANIDTAEIFRPSNEAERAHGMEAKAFLEDLFLYKQILIKTSKTGKYGRYIAELIYLDQNVSELLVENGFEKKESYDSDVSSSI